MHFFTNSYIYFRESFSTTLFGFISSSTLFILLFLFALNQFQQPMVIMGGSISIVEEEYNHFLSMHSNSVGSGSTDTLAQQGTSPAYLAT